MKKVEKTTTEQSSTTTSDPIVVTDGKQEAKTSWRRLTLSLLGIIIITGIWQWATWHLYSLPPGSITAFNSITNNTMYTIATLVVFFVTGQVFFNWKNDTVSSVVQEGRHLVEERRETLTQNINQHIVEQGVGNAPETRPFSHAAMDDGDFID